MRNPMRLDSVSSIALQSLSVLSVLLTATVPTQASMACWWNGVTLCRASNVEGEAHFCRTPSPESCQLDWDRKSALPANVVLHGGVLYELAPNTTIASVPKIQVLGSYSESELRPRIAKALRVPASALIRRAAWFYSTDAESPGGFDRDEVPSTDLCISLGTSWGLARLRLSHCVAGDDGRELYNQAFVPSEYANVIPVEDVHRRFVAVVVSQTIDSSGLGARRAPFDGSAWFANPPLLDNP
jgi:hypothetical protein